MRFPNISSVTAIKNCLLHVVFTDGTEGEYDVSHLSGRGVFKSWDRDDTFYRVFINPDSGAIPWPGELDIDTVNIYCSIKNISVDTSLSREAHVPPIHFPY